MLFDAWTERRSDNKEHITNIQLIMEQNKESVVMTDIVAMVKKKTGMDKKDILKSFHGILGAISASVDDGKEVVIPDFGVFYSKEVAEHKKTLWDKSVIDVPARNVVRFRPYKNFTSYYMKQL